MKLNRTRDEWAKRKADGRWYFQGENMALEDIATLFAEVERLWGALQWIERRGSPQSYADNPTRLSEVMAHIARQALGDTHD